MTHPRGAVDDHRHLRLRARRADPGPPRTAGKPSARATIAVWLSGAAEYGREPRDALRVHQRGIGRA